MDKDKNKQNKKNRLHNKAEAIEADVVKGSKVIKGNKTVVEAEVLPKLKPKTKAMLELMDSNPKLSQSTAYLMTHETKSKETARANASRLLASANVKIYRQNTEQMAKRIVVDVASHASGRRKQPAFQRLALDAANSILDRNLGKPTIKQETQATSLNLNVEASQELNDAFTAFLKDSTKQT